MSYGPAVPRASLAGEAWRRVRTAWRENDNVRRGDGRVAILFLLPDLIGFVAFTLSGILGTFGISFLRWNLVQPPNWVGLNNYRDLLGDPLFWQVLGNTAYYAVGVVPISTALALLIALGLNRKLAGATIFRTAYFAPFITTLSAAALLWQWIFDPNLGLIDSFLYINGIYDPPSWLNSTSYTMRAPLYFAMS